MWREIGFAAVIGVASIVLVIPLQGVYLKEILIMKLEVTVHKYTYGTLNNMTQVCMKMSLQPIIMVCHELKEILIMKLEVTVYKYT
jgi:hypothetical protein